MLPRYIAKKMHRDSKDYELNIEYFTSQTRKITRPAVVMAISWIVYLVDAFTCLRVNLPSS